MNEDASYIIFTPEDSYLQSLGVATMLSLHLFLLFLSSSLVLGETSTKFPEEWNDWALHTSSATYHEVSNHFSKCFFVFSLRSVRRIVFCFVRLLFFPSFLSMLL